MERKKTYEFDDLEISIIKEALAMYTGYQWTQVLPMLMGDESDADKIHEVAVTSRSMFRTFYEIDNQESWEEATTKFAEEHGRPMDMNDISEYDWHDHERGQ